MAIQRPKRQLEHQLPQEHRHSAEPPAGIAFHFIHAQGRQRMPSLSSEAARQQAQCLVPDMSVDNHFHVPPMFLLMQLDFDLPEVPPPRFPPFQRHLDPPVLPFRRPAERIVAPVRNDPPRYDAAEWLLDLEPPPLSRDDCFREALRDFNFDASPDAFALLRDGDFDPPLGPLTPRLHRVNIGGSVHAFVARNLDLLIEDINMRKNESEIVFSPLPSSNGRRRLICRHELPYEQELSSWEQEKRLHRRAQIERKAQRRAACREQRYAAKAQRQRTNKAQRRANKAVQRKARRGRHAAGIKMRHR